MDWKSTSKMSDRHVSPEDLKVCDLCGTLNHNKNSECFTCGWHGHFQSDPDMVRLAWLRLAHQYEEVRLEHVTARSRPIVDEFGQKGSADCWQQFCERWQAWWRGLLASHRPRSASREHPAHKQHTAPRNDSGVV